MTEKDKEINIINDKMVKLYSKIFKLKHKLNLCSKDCPEDEPKEVNAKSLDKA
jgi:hypothetical protein